MLSSMKRLCRLLPAALVAAALGTGCYEERSGGASGGGGAGGTTGYTDGVGGTAGITGGAGVSGNPAIAGSAGVTGGVGGMADCLGEDPPGAAGYAGGACDGAYGYCDGDMHALPTRVCGFLVNNARQSVFEQVRDCLGDHPDSCEGGLVAAVEACTAPAFDKACIAPGVMVDGQPRDCGSLSGDCPEVSRQQCDTLMSVLNERARQQAYECYFSGSSAYCSDLFYDCIGLPRI